MSVKIITEDIFKTNCDLILHQVNCQGVMGSGIAKEIRKRMSESGFNDYRNFVLTYKEKALGSVVFALRTDSINKKQWFVHCIAQQFYGRDGKCYTDYEALQKCFITTYKFAKQHNLTVAIPYKIGCGLAGGDWNIVYQMICDIFIDCSCNIYKL